MPKQLLLLTAKNPKQLKDALNIISAMCDLEVERVKLITEEEIERIMRDYFISASPKDMSYEIHREIAKAITKALMRNE